MDRDPALLLDMLLSARRVQRFTASATRQTFEADDVLNSAAHYQMQIIGEAASKVSREFRDAHPEIPWVPIIGLRHRLVHDYARISADQIWDIIQKHLPSLIEMLVPLIPPETPSV